MNNKRGKIEISKALLEDSSLHNCLNLIFSNFIPYFIVQENFDTLSYYGVSDFFDVVLEGETVPNYTAVITKNNGGVSIEFQRLK